MAILKAGLYLDVNARRIFKVDEISRRRVCDLNEADALQLLDNENTLVFVHAERDSLTQVEGESRVKIRQQIVSHIAADSEDFDLAEFESGYCFTAESWKGEAGKPILVLHYYH